MILFFVILAALILPLYGLLLRDRKMAREHEKAITAQNNAREGVILDVVRENSAAVSECTSILASTKQAIDRIHTRLDGALARQ